MRLIRGRDAGKKVVKKGISVHPGIFDGYESADAAKETR